MRMAVPQGTNQSSISCNLMQMALTISWKYMDCQKRIPVTDLPPLSAPSPAPWPPYLRQGPDPDDRKGDGGSRPPHGHQAATPPEGKCASPSCVALRVAAFFHELWGLY